MAINLAAAADIVPAREAGPTSAHRKAVIVVGAGRSSTSVLTAGVGALGANLGDSLKPGGVKKNPNGFFEDTDRPDVNHRVHKALGLRASGANVRLVGPGLAHHRFRGAARPGGGDHRTALRR